jgi:hypothetical protein
LITALAYEVIFKVPISTLFTGIRTNVMDAVEKNIDAFEKDLKGRGGKDRSANVVAQKLQWLETRRNI